ncbi:hypothetical protein DSO57_1029401 [Entomophthora muscae]|uniref:Uncharacterized protein n=1 Tax=Entomophthora muscae TaxID=34485 RepID=A0ACC2SE41_9FUNG|nr:hypothetical protein DSO57_1029401 [Entomophthora muscae]
MHEMIRSVLAVSNWFGMDVPIGIKFEEVHEFEPRHTLLGKVVSHEGVERSPDGHTHESFGGMLL